MPKDTPKTFAEHTQELVSRLKVVLYTLIISTIIFMVFPANLSFLRNPLESYEPLVAVILRALKAQILPPDAKLIGIEVTAPIELYVLTSFILGVTVTIPVFAYELYRFVDPALLPEERRAIYPFIISVSLLFVGGASFGLIVLTPVFISSLFPFFSVVGAEPIISVMDFYNLIFTVILVTGGIFTFPAFFVLLVKFGIVNTEMFRKRRRYVYAALVIIAMLISPGSSPQGNLLLFLPLIILFEIAIFFGKRYEEKGEVKPIRLPWQRPRCKFCNAEIPEGSQFCPKCRRSQV